MAVAFRVSFRNALIAFALAVQAIASGAGVAAMAPGPDGASAYCAHPRSDEPTRRSPHECLACVLCADAGAAGPLADFLTPEAPRRTQMAARCIASGASAPRDQNVSAHRARAPPAAA